MLKKSSILIMALCISACAPSIKPELVKKINSYYDTSSSNTYKASNMFKRAMPYAVGQYIITGTTDKDGKKSISKTSIVGRERGGWIMETYSITPSSESKMQMLIKGVDMVYNTGSLDNLDILWVKIKSDDGTIQTIDGKALEFTKGLYRRGFSNMEVNQTVFKDGGTVSVPAGHFEGTTKSETKSSFLGMTFSAECYYHSKVPINGVVKLISKDNNMVVELLDFGLSGAKSSF